MSSSATATHALGERLVTSDGRVFRYAQAGGTLLVAGNFLQAPAEVSTHQGLTPTNTAIGATSLTVTLGATNAATANQYAGGWAVVTVTPGLGQIFGISGHPAAAAAAALTLTLTDAVSVALTAAASKIDLIPNPYKGVIQAPITTLTGAVAGVCVFPIPANEYGWIQRSGPACALIAGTPGPGVAIVVPGSAAGAAVVDGAAAATLVVGSMLETGGNGETNGVMLALE
jgi:hypothetical protein